MTGCDRLPTQQVCYDECVLQMDTAGYQTLYVDGYNPDALFNGYGYEGWGTDQPGWNQPVCGFDGLQYQNYCEFKCNIGCH